MTNAEWSLVVAVINAIGEISKQEAVDALERELWRPHVSVQHAEVSEVRADEVPEHQHLPERELSTQTQTHGTSARSDILAWLNLEQRKAERWFRTDRGIFSFALTGTELMRIRHVLGESDGEWQCRFVFTDQTCCRLPKGHTGEHSVGDGQ